MCSLSRTATFKFKYSNEQFTVPMLGSIRGLRSKGYRPDRVEFNFGKEELLTVKELEWIEQCVKPALDKNSHVIMYNESK